MGIKNRGAEITDVHESEQDMSFGLRLQEQLLACKIAIVRLERINIPSGVVNNDNQVNSATFTEGKLERNKFSVKEKQRQSVEKFLENSRSRSNGQNNDSKKQETVGKLYPCVLCPKNFGLKKNLQEHVRLFHPQLL